MKRLFLAVFIFSACDDTIPGLCNVDSDCAPGTTGQQSYCYLGVCVVADEDGGDPSLGDGGASDAGPSDGGTTDTGVGDGGELSDAGWQDAGPSGLGAACSSAGQCASGYCTDGVCCDAPCNDKVCQRCDGKSTSGSGHCGFALAGTNLDSDCPLPVTNCSGKCKFLTSTASCTGTTFGCAYQQETKPVPSGQICSSNVVAPVSKDEHCSSGRSCVDSIYQASSWWTSCNGKGDCRNADDRTDAALETASCGDYLCDPVAIQCKSRCNTDSDCAPGTICSDSLCAQSWAWANWPVSGTKSYTRTTEGKAIDNVTKLEWTRGISWSQPSTWAGSIEFCRAWGANWRLPAPIELLSIVNLSMGDGWGPDLIVGNLQASSTSGLSWGPDVWSSLPVAGDPGSAWFVSYHGFPQKASITERKFIRCVRTTTP